MDTNVIAAAVLGESETGQDAIRLIEDSGWDLTAPSHWKAEFANVAWKAVRMGRIPGDELGLIFDRASSLPIESVDIAELWRGAVVRAVVTEHSAYDTLFVELAILLNTNVASYDVQLHRKFPAIVVSPRVLLAR